MNKRVYLGSLVVIVVLLASLFGGRAWGLSSAQSQHQEELAVVEKAYKEKVSGLEEQLRVAGGYYQERLDKLSVQLEEKYRSDLGRVKDAATNTGYKAGYEDGNRVGYDSGYNEGKSAGYNEGREVGLKEGKNLGYQSGKEDGYREGWSNALLEYGSYRPYYSPRDPSPYYPPPRTLRPYSYSQFNGEVYRGENFEQYVGSLPQTDSINYNWGTGGPLGLWDYFSVRWQGSAYFEGGYYRFTLRADDGVRLYIDGTLVINSWKPQIATLTATKYLSPGYHDVRLEYFERTGEAFVSLAWTLN